MTQCHFFMLSRKEDESTVREYDHRTQRSLDLDTKLVLIPNLSKKMVLKKTQRKFSLSPLVGVKFCETFQNTLK